jgi:hypothetical protein
MPRLVSNLARTFLVVSAFSLQASMASAQECRKDTDCAGDTVCDEGRCVGADGPVAKPKTTAPAPGPAAASPAPQAAAQPAAVAGAVKVDFVNRNSNEKLVVRERYMNVSCTAPCSMNLTPGVHSMQIGDSSHPEEIDVPGGGGTFSVAEPERGKRTSGIVLLSVGAPVALLSGLLAVAANASAESSAEVSGITEEKDDGAKTAATVCTIIAVTGGALAVVGLYALISADTKPFRPEAAKVQGKARTLLPTAGIDGRGGGFVGLGGTF